MNSTPPPAFFILLSVLCITILLVRRENVIVPLIIAMCFLPADISIQIFTLDFYAVRIVALVGLAKVLFLVEPNKIIPNKIDKIFYLYVIIGSIIYVLVSNNLFGAFIYKSGKFVDSIILYIVLRKSIITKDSIRLIIKTFSICVIVLLPFVIYEFYSSKNLFAIFGRSFISIRDGEIRAAATFSHSILFGSFAAALVPILWAQYKADKSKILLFAIGCAVFYVYASSSSGPLVVFVVVVLFLIFFKWKQYSKLLARLMLASAIFLHFVREGPLWHLLYVRISVKSGSTGWHRYLLTDAAVKEFPNWWLLGYGDAGPQWHTKYWAYTHAKFTDVTNHYILEGVRGGFVTMSLFVLICYLVIKTLGAHSISQKSEADQWLWWGAAVMMISHCVTFLSVAYFGQITMLLYLTIALGAFSYDSQNKMQ